MRSKIIITLIALLVGLIAAALGQQKEYKPTEVQSLKLQLRQRDAQLAQVALREAQSNFQQKVKDLMEEGVQVRKDNSWPDNVTMDPDRLTFALTENAKTDKKEPSKP